MLVLPGCSRGTFLTLLLSLANLLLSTLYSLHNDEMSTKTPAPYSWYYDIAKLSGERPELLNGIFGTKPSSISEYNGTSLACAGSPYRRRP
ncbi:hypothetical protein PtrM4_129850 [Pyrenophora tritici-repentis]|uniref:Uncharacterized protein n=1 Tax=Pyrenophora tritici-repentis TaxID=45151 RepID=A0A834VNL5_9PLEO|nr:hypothetical protein PtrM4_129850 [Pyrenophora tritici-repentis]